MEKVISGLDGGRRCLECGAAFKGRSDKRYCSDFCRNSWHNRRNRDCNNLVRLGNNRLRRNYRILSELLGKKESARVATAELWNKGFDFNWYTRVSRTKTGPPCYIVYTLGYQRVANGCCQLYRNPPVDSPSGEIPISSCENLV